MLTVLVNLWLCLSVCNTCDFHRHSLGSITSQLVDVFTSCGNIVSLIDEIGELQFEGPAACGATLGKSTSDHADPACSCLAGRMD